VPAAAVFLAAVGEWHPASNVAATNMIGTMLRMVEQLTSNVPFLPVRKPMESDPQILIKRFHLLARHPARS
jgi:hypothetical protein